MEIGVLDLASRIVAQTLKRSGATLYVRADRARAALYAARRQAAAVARDADMGLSPELRQATADRLSAALAAIFDLADIVGADVGSLARAAVAAAGGADPRADDVPDEVDHPEPQTDSARRLPIDPGEPHSVDGWPWTKRDEIAAQLLIAGQTPGEAVRLASMLISVRNAQNRVACGEHVVTNMDGEPLDEKPVPKGTVVDVDMERGSWSPRTVSPDGGMSTGTTPGLLQRSEAEAARAAFVAEIGEDAVSAREVTEVVNWKRERDARLKDASPLREA